MLPAGLEGGAEIVQIDRPGVCRGEIDRRADRLTVDEQRNASARPGGFAAACRSLATIARNARMVACVFPKHPCRHCDDSHLTARSACAAQPGSCSHARADKAVTSVAISWAPHALAMLLVPPSTSPLACCWAANS